MGFARQGDAVAEFAEKLGHGAGAGANEQRGAARRTPAPPEPPKNIDVYVRATDNSIRYKRYHGYYGVWDGSFTNLGGSMTSDPTSASWGEGRVDVFAGSSSGSASWRIHGQPGDACSWGWGHLDVYVRGNDNGLWHRGYSTLEFLAVGSGNVGHASMPFTAMATAGSVTAGLTAVGMARKAWGRNPGWRPRRLFVEPSAVSG